MISRSPGIPSLHAQPTPASRSSTEAARPAAQAQSQTAAAGATQTQLSAASRAYSTSEVQGKISGTRSFSTESRTERSARSTGFSTTPSAAVVAAILPRHRVTQLPAPQWQSCAVKAAGVKLRTRIKGKDTSSTEKGNKWDHFLLYLCFQSLIKSTSISNFIIFLFF